MLLNSMKTNIDDLYILDGYLLHSKNYRFIDCLTNKDIKECDYYNSLLASIKDEEAKSLFEDIYKVDEFIILVVDDIVYVLNQSINETTYRVQYYDCIMNIITIFIKYVKQHNKTLNYLYDITKTILKWRCVGCDYRNIDNTRYLVYYLITSCKHLEVFRKCIYFYVNYDLEINKNMDKGDLYSLGLPMFYNNTKNVGSYIDVDYGLTNILYKKGDIYLVHNEKVGNILHYEGKYYKVFTGYGRSTFDIRQVKYHNSECILAGKNIIRLSTLNLCAFKKRMYTEDLTTNIEDYLNTLLGLNSSLATDEDFILSDVIDGHILIDWDVGSIYTFWDIDMLYTIYHKGSNTITIHSRNGFNIQLESLTLDSLVVYKVDTLDENLYEFNLVTNSLTLLGDYNEPSVQSKLKSIRDSLKLGIMRL